MRNFGQAMSVSAVPLLTALLQRHIAVLAISSMYKRRVVCLTHQALHNKELPADIQDIVTMHSTARKTRDNLKSVLQRPKTEYGRKTFKQRAAITWNTLQESIKSLENYSTFKKCLTKHSRTFDLVTFNNSAMVKNKDIDFLSLSALQFYSLGFILFF